MAKKFKYQHILSSVNGKAPTASQMLPGEVAVNNYAGNEKLYIRNSSDEIISFATEHEIEEMEQTLVSGITDIESRMATKDAVEALGARVNECVTKDDLETDFYTKEETSSKTEIHDALAGKSNTGHTHHSNEVADMSGYTKPTSTSAIETGDTLNQAIGKLEKAIENKPSSDTWRPVKVDGTDFITDTSTALNLNTGANVTLTTGASGTITVSAQDTTYTAATAAPGNIATSSSVGTSANYARQDHTHGIDLATGDENGQVKIAGTNVSVKGLGTAAYKNSGFFAEYDHIHDNRYFTKVELTGGTSAVPVSKADEASYANQSYLNPDITTNKDYSLLWGKNTSPSAYTSSKLYHSSADLTYNPSTKTLHAEIFSGTSTDCSRFSEVEEMEQTLVSGITDIESRMATKDAVGSLSIRVNGLESYKQDVISDCRQIGFGYAVSDTAGDVAAKLASLSGFILKPYSVVSVLFENEFTVSNSTLNINSTGAKPIYLYGSSIPMNKVKNSTILTMVYDGARYNVISINSAVSPDDGYVDLSLPSGLLWATCNIGSSTPEGNGLYFSWGNVEGHEKGSGYDFGTSNDGPYASTSGASLTGNIPVGDNYDAARANLGGSWRMPTTAEFAELFNTGYTTNEWVTQNGINGRRVTSKINGNSVFFPAAGNYYGTTLFNEGTHGSYWSSSLYSQANAYNLYFFSSGVYPQNNNHRFYGFTVRAVQ